MPDSMPNLKDREKPIRIGIIGAGHFALNTQWPRLKEDKRAIVTAVCRRNEKLLSAAKLITGAENAYTDWSTMLESDVVDAVIVCTPNDLHKEPVIAALKRGIDVLVEKPMALTSQDAKEMTKAAESSSASLMVGYNRRCNPDLRLAQKMVAEGRIGVVRQICMVSFADFSFVWNPEPLISGAKERGDKSGDLGPFLADAIKKGNWRSDATRAGGGFFVDMATHYIDTMLWFGQGLPINVSCFSGMNSLTADGSMAVQASLNNHALLTITFTDGVKSGSMFASTLTVIGDDGVLFVNEGHVQSELNGIRIVADGHEELISSDEKNIGTAGMFMDLITNKGENPAPASDCYWTVALTEAAYQSADRHCIIEIAK